MASILFTSESLFDINIGLVSLVYKEYDNPNIIKSEFKDVAVSFLQQYLLEQALEPNILEIIFKDKTISKDYYDLFLKDEWLNIIKQSPTTSIVELIKTYKISKGATNINPVILSRSEEERAFIASLIKNIDIIVCPNEELNKFDLGMFSKIVVGDIRFLSNFNLERIAGKSILVLAYRYNFDVDNDSKLLSTISYISDINEFETALPYIDYEPPVG